MKMFKYLSSALLMALAVTACSPEKFDEVNPNALPEVSQYEDAISVTVDQNTNTVYYSFESRPGITPVWTINGTSYSGSFSGSQYFRKAGDYTIECKVKNRNGVSDGAIVKTVHIDKTRMNGFAGFQTDTDFNLFNKATFQAPTFWYAPGWNQIADPQCSVDNVKKEFAITLPEATTDQWQAQMFVTTDIAVQAGTNYDFSCIFTSSKDHPHVTVKLGSASDSNFGLYYNPSVELKADEPLCVYFSDVPCTQSISDLQLIFDFGGNAEATVINIESFVLKDHANDDGTEVPKAAEAVFDYDAESNLWLPVDKNNAYTMTYYYAPGWAQIADPDFTGDNGVYTVTLPAATWERWQAQVAMHTEVSAEADQEYDLSVSFHSNKALGGVTAKLTQEDNDDNFLAGSDGVFAIDEDANYDFQIAKAKFKSGAADKLKLVFDFGGNAEGTVITISKITFQKHRE